MNISEIYQTVNYIAGKETNGLSFTPEQFNLIFPETETDFFRSIARPEANQYHAWRTLKGAVDDIRLHTLKESVTLTFASGVADIPTDFRDWLSFALLTTVDDGCGNKVDSEVPVEVVEDDEWASRLIASIRRPTLSFPIIKLNATQIQNRPTGATPMRLTYYKIPAKPVFAYTIVNDEIVYDPINSVQSSLPEVTHEQIISILLGKVGIHLQFEQVANYAREAKTQI